MDADRAGPFCLANVGAVLWQWTSFGWYGDDDDILDLFLQEKMAHVFVRDVNGAPYL